MAEIAAQTKQRRYPRITLPKGLLVAWQGVCGRTVSRVQTLGLGGVFVSLPNPPPVGSNVKLLLEVPAGYVRALGIVRYSKNNEGMGVEFISMNFEDRGRLNRLLKRLTH